MKRWMHALLFSILCGGVSTVQAASVALLGIFPGKAVLSVDGSPPRTLSVGQSIAGVKLLAMERDAATVEIAGKRERIVLGNQPLTISPASAQSGTQSITLVADSQGHFFTQGSLNGAPVRFMVDTGATAIALGAGQAKQAGIAYTDGERTMVSTANGVVPAWRVRIERVTVNGLTLNDIEGLVVSIDMPHVLLGMSFLNRMSMNRDGSTMVLKRRY